MKNRFNTLSRCSATGVATGCILVVILVMGASLLFETAAPAPGATAAGAPNMAQSHRADEVKKG